MNQPPVQYVMTNDGVRIAYSATGGGPPLVFLPIPPNKTMEVAWGFPRPFRPWLEGLAGRFRLIQFDNRGVGLSSRDVADMSIAGHGYDLVAVVEQLNLGRFVILACSGFGHVALRYALTNPDRVEALILIGCPVSGRVWSRAMFEALPEDDWKLFMRSQIPAGLTLEENHRYLEAVLQGATQESTRAGLRGALAGDVGDILPLIKTPTLVMHSRDQLELLPEESMRLAALIPGARMVLLDGADMFGNHEQGLQAIDDFIQSLPQKPPDSAPLKRQPAGGLSVREVEVLRLIAAGRSNAQIAEELVISPSTVLHHVTNIFSKTGSANRTEAATYAIRAGLA